MTKKSREDWLMEATKAMRPWFKAKGHPIPKNVGVACGWAKGNAKAIGQCFDPKNHADKCKARHEIWICPTQDEPTRVLDILLHELIHAAVGIDEGHKGLFRQLAKEFGLEGKMTATYVTPGTDLHNRLASLAKKLGRYPHGALTKPVKASKPTNKWIRLYSKHAETYTLTISPKSIEEFGYPTDPWGDQMLPKE